MTLREVLPLLRAGSGSALILPRTSSRLVSTNSPINFLRHYRRGASSNLKFTNSANENDEEEDAEPVGKAFEFSNQKHEHKQHRNTEPINNSKSPYDRPFKHIVVPGKISPRLPVPEEILLPTYAKTDGKVKPYAFEGPFEIKGAKSIQAMRESCALARKILDFAGTLVKVNLIL